MVGAVGVMRVVRLVGAVGVVRVVGVMHVIRILMRMVAVLLIAVICHLYETKDRTSCTNESAFAGLGGGTMAFWILLRRRCRTSLRRWWIFLRRCKLGLVRWVDRRRRDARIRRWCRRVRRGCVTWGRHSRVKRTRVWRVCLCMRIIFWGSTKAGDPRWKRVGRVGRRVGARHRHRARKGRRQGIVRVVTADVGDRKRGGREHG